VGKPKTPTNSKVGKPTPEEDIFAIEQEEKETVTKTISKVEKRDTTEEVQVIQKPENELVKKINSGEKVFFRWNGRTITSMAHLKYDHCYSFENINDYSKVKVLSYFGKTRKVVEDKYQGRSGILFEDGYTIREGMTSREIDALPRVDNGSNTRDVANPYNITGAKATIDSQAPVAPHVVKKVVDLISEQEYLADKNNEYKINSNSMHTREEDRVD